MISKVTCQPAKNVSRYRLECGRSARLYRFTVKFRDIARITSQLDIINCEVFSRSRLPLSNLCSTGRTLSSSMVIIIVIIMRSYYCIYIHNRTDISNCSAYNNFYMFYLTSKYLISSHLHILNCLHL